MRRFALIALASLAVGIWVGYLLGAGATEGERNARKPAQPEPAPVPAEPPLASSDVSWRGVLDLLPI
jgi:hypothetical protein